MREPGYGVKVGFCERVSSSEREHENFLELVHTGCKGTVLTVGGLEELLVIGTELCGVESIHCSILFPLEAVESIVRCCLVFLLELGLSVLEKVLPHASFLGLHLLGITSIKEDDIGVDVCRVNVIDDLLRLLLHLGVFGYESGFAHAVHVTEDVHALDEGLFEGRRHQRWDGAVGVDLEIFWRKVLRGSWEM